MPDFTLVGKFDFSFVEALGWGTAIAVVVSVALSDFFDTMGTVIGIGGEADLLDIRNFGSKSIDEVKAKGAQKDLDNMAKAIVDAVKNVLFGDDRRIDHLNIIRIKSPDEEFVYLNIRQTKLNEHNDVLVPRMLHSWAGAEVLNLEDFIEP